jgi:hypothetical protein
VSFHSIQSLLRTSLSYPESIIYIYHISLHCRDFPSLIFYFVIKSQESCTSAPSKVQSGASLCNWSSDDQSCTLAPPPSDPIFTILVALLTIIMSIPIVMLLQYVINEFACKRPGSKSPETEIPTPNSSEVDSVPQSDFGKLILSGAVDDAEMTSPSDAALLAYTGNADTIIDISCVDS